MVVVERELWESGEIFKRTLGKGLDTGRGFQRDWEIKLRVARQGDLEVNLSTTKKNGDVNLGMGDRKGEFESGIMNESNDWVRISLEGFEKGTSQESVQSLLGQFLKYWRSFRVLEGGRKFEFLIHGEKAAKGVANQLGGWRLGEDGRTV